MNLRKMRMLNHVFLDTAGGDGAQGGGGGGQGGQGEGAGGGSAGAGAGGGEGGAGGQGGGAGSSSSLAAGGGQGGAAGGGAAAAIHEVIAEKYRVNKADGTFDLEASARKQAEGYASLEKKLGAPSAAVPASPDAYAPEVKIDGFKWDEFKGDARMQSFLKGAHANGISNDQLSFLLSEYVPALQAATDGNVILTQEQCDTTLKEHWKSDAEFTAGKQAAHRVASVLCEKAGIPFAELEKPGGLGDNALFIRLVASFASELGEAPPPAGTAVGGTPADIKALMASEAYQNPRHPDYEEVSKKVSAYYQGQHKK